MEHKVLVDLRHGADMLFRVITRNRPLISKFENDRAAIYGQLNNEANRAFLLVRKLMKAVEIRLDEITAALNQPNTLSEEELKRRAMSPLVLPADRVNSLISEKVEPPVPLNGLEERFAELLRILDIEAAQQAKKKIIPTW